MIRTILSIALSKKWYVRQIDVQNAFLHGELSEDVYMAQPPWFTHPQYPNHSKLHKALYGLKQVSRAWFSHLTTWLLQFGFISSQSDPSLYILHHLRFTMYFLIYVDIIITNSNTSTIDELLGLLRAEFAI